VEETCAYGIEQEASEQNNWSKGCKAHGAPEQKDSANGKFDDNRDCGQRRGRPDGEMPLRVQQSRNLAQLRCLGAGHDQQYRCQEPPNDLPPIMIPRVMSVP